MVQSASSAPWQTAMALYDLGSTARMLHYLASAITKDAQGYADAVPLSDPGLAVPPSAMSATYASYLNSQATHAVRRLFQPGLNTTYFISVDREVFRGAGQYGWRDTDHQAPARLPVYALRISTGGAVIIFCTYDTAGWAAVSSSAPLPAQPSGIEGNYVPPGFVVQALGLTSVRAGTRLTVTAVDRVLAFVQPHGVGSINVLINNGAATRVQNSVPQAKPGNSHHRTEQNVLSVFPACHRACPNERIVGDTHGQMLNAQRFIVTSSSRQDCCHMWPGPDRGGRPRPRRPSP
jgi:hypothetical protein